MAPTEMNHLDTAFTKAREVYGRKIADADQILENWRNEAARLVRESAEGIAKMESDLELLDALEQERRAAALRLELHHAVQTHHSVVDNARNMVQRAMSECTVAYAAAAAAMGQSLAESFAA